MSVMKFDPKEMERIGAFLEAVPELEGLDALEPRNEKSEAYDIWAELHEDLEDVLDEVLDLLEG